MYAGSLLDFLIQEIGLPEGRIQSRYMQPVSLLDWHSSSPHTVRLNTAMPHAQGDVRSYPLYCTPALFSGRERIEKSVGASGAQ